MTEEARRDWLTVAWETLGHIPPSILEIGARKARLTCDHPSKIVPTIIAETADHMRLHRETQSEVRPLQIAGPKPQYCTAAEAAAILQEYGLKPTRSTS
jgi:hypothetical protein